MNFQKGNSSAIVGILAALFIIGAGVWYYMKQGTMAAAPMAPAPAVVDNSALSASDDPASIEKDADDAYMTQLQADIDADLKAIESI